MQVCIINFKFGAHVKNKNNVESDLYNEDATKRPHKIKCELLGADLDFFFKGIWFWDLVKDFKQDRDNEQYKK